MDYTNPNSTSTLGNKILFYSEPIFTALFTLEATIKILALGLIMDKNCYLRDAWNWLDLAVVITGLLDFMPNMKNVSVLRTFRLFRPLRSLSALP